MLAQECVAVAAAAAVHKALDFNLINTTAERQLHRSSVAVSNRM